MMNLLKKLAACGLSLTMILSLAACGGTDDTSSGESGGEPVKYLIGISQYGQHGSLDNCREGFLQGLEQAGLVEGTDFEVDYQNANFDDNPWLREIETCKVVGPDGYAYEPVWVNPVDARELGREVFADQPRVAERFEAAVEKGALPERVVVEKAVAKRVTKSHKIRTDTGIELTFPAEYGENSDFIEFFSTPDGRIEIALKNIGAIENR